MYRILPKKSQNSSFSKLKLALAIVSSGAALLAASSIQTTLAQGYSFANEPFVPMQQQFQPVRPPRAGVVELDVQSGGGGQSSGGTITNKEGKGSAGNAADFAVDVLKTMTMPLTDNPVATAQNTLPLGNFCSTPAGRFGPGPFNPLGSLCNVMTPYGVVYGRVSQ